MAAEIEEFQPMNKMFCYQCEQTSHGMSCTKTGECGKTAEVAMLQDLLIHKLKELSFFVDAFRANKKSIKFADQPPFPSEEMSDVVEVPFDVHKMNVFLLDSIFATMTNVNFDDDRFIDYLRETEGYIAQVKAAANTHLGLTDQFFAKACGKQYRQLPSRYASVLAEGDIFELTDIAGSTGVEQKQYDVDNEDVVGAQELVVYGLKGAAAYAAHAQLIGKEDSSVYSFAYEALAFLTSPDALDLSKCLEMALRVGSINYLVMKLLSEANATFGEPEPTEVPVRPKPGKCILVTGHDLSMLHDVLEATKDRGIQVYTHGELMPAHTYPKLKAYPHLAGHFGGAWQNQRRQFSKFPGAILVTTNCLMPLIHKSPYKDRIFTTGVCGGEDIQHLESTKDLSKLIQAAEAAPGFTEADTEFNVRDPVQKHMPPSFHVGHSYQWIVKNAQTVLKLIQEGKIKRFYLVGGCDGSEGERSFYTDLVKQLPQTSVVMTLGCGKYRINHLEEGMGKIDGTLPRLLDLGQCNDAFGAIQVALTLADALNCGVNDLPLSIVLSWFEQKAVAVLLTLLFLKVKPLYIGPKLPGFLTKNVLDVLSRDFGLVPLATEHEVEAKMSPPEWGTFQQLVSLAA